jgi:2,3-dihydroxybenzoate-AMP ligase
MSTPTTSSGRAGDLRGDQVPFPAEFANRYRAAGLWKDQTLSQALESTAAADPTRPALVTAALTWTYGDLLTKVNNVAAGLLTAGLEPGDRVLLQLSNSAQAVSAWYGLLKAGLVPVCTLAIHREHEIRQIGHKTGAVAHLIQTDFPGYDLNALARAMRDDLPSMRTLITAGQPGDQTPETAVRIEDLEKRAAAPGELAQLGRIQDSIDLDKAAVLQLSGGTTGTPKIIPRLHPDYWYNGLAAAQWWGLGPDDRLAFALPIAHNAGIANALLGAHSVGAALLLATPQPDQLLPLMAEHGATWLLTPPGVMRDYLDDHRFDAAFRSVRSCVLTAAPVSQELFDEIQGRGLAVTQAFGMTEGLFLFTPPGSSDLLRATTVGVPISAHDEVRLLEPGTESLVEDGQAGELCVRGPYSIRGYLAEPERNAEAFTSDGFYRSGDLAVKVTIGGEHGYALAGRSKDLINRGGEKINAEEIETLLAHHPDVIEVALVAFPDPRLGERACAFVVTRPGAPTPTVETFRDYLDSSGVAKFKWPERVESIESLPRTNIGKIQKRTLRDIARAHHGPPS